MSMCTRLSGETAPPPPAAAAIHPCSDLASVIRSAALSIPDVLEEEKESEEKQEPVGHDEKESEEKQEPAGHEEKAHFKDSQTSSDSEECSKENKGHSSGSKNKCTFDHWVPTNLLV